MGLACGWLDQPHLLADRDRDWICLGPGGGEMEIGGEERRGGGERNRGSGRLDAQEVRGRAVMTYQWGPARHVISCSQPGMLEC